MKASVEYAFVAGDQLVRTGRHLAVLMLPLVCWLAAQECPAQAALAWVVQCGMALVATPRTAARSGENFDISRIRPDTFEEIDRNQINRRQNKVVKSGIPGFIPEGA